MATSESYIINREGDDMARRRLQRNGHLYRQNGVWKLRWREDVRDANGKVKRVWSKPVWIGPCEGPNKLTKPSAARRAWDDWLSKIDQNNLTPKSMATLDEFVRTKFRPEHITLALKHSTRIGYESILRAHILPAIGHLKMRDIKRDDIQSLVAKMVTAKLSPQTVYHTRNVISAIFRLAEDCEWCLGNPARRVRLPELVYKQRRALTQEEFRELVKHLPEPYRAMAVILGRTGMRISELIGLKWKYVNLSDKSIIAGQEAIPPYTIAVRENFTKGEWGTLKTRGSRRDIPMTADTWIEFVQVWEQVSSSGPVAAVLPPPAGSGREIPATMGAVVVLDTTRMNGAGAPDPDSTVFVNRKGGPLDAHNFANRHFKQAAKLAGVPWATIHCLRYTAATMTDQAGLSMSERMGFLGHTNPATTTRYTSVDIERLRSKMEGMEKGMVQ